MQCPSQNASFSGWQEGEKEKMLQVNANQPAKRKLGRPPKDPADLRTDRVEVFFSLAERLRLAGDAQACGLSPAAYIRKLIAGNCPVAQAYHVADPRLLLELNAIGNNIKQTLSAIQSGAHGKADWRQLQLLLEDVLARVALEGISISPKLLLQLHAAGTLLNRAVADMHAGSERKHDWHEIRQTLQSLLMEVVATDVH